jgi:phosphoglucomutase
MGLLPPNHYLCASIFYLFQHRPKWNKLATIGKTIVSSEIINRIASKLGRKIYEVPVGFKWFAQGLLDGTIEFCGEESAGASFSRLDGSVWTTDKDGIVPALLSAEMTARLGHDPGEIYRELEQELGKSYFKRVDANATPALKKSLEHLSTKLHATHLAGEKIQKIVSKASGNDAPIGGLKVSAENGWFAARPSGTEDIYRIYAESFKSEDHLQHIITEAQKMISDES